MTGDCWMELWCSKARVLARPEQNWSGKLYREFQPEEAKPVNVKFIPYSVWQNRGPSEMSVWLPRVVRTGGNADF